MAKPFLKWVGGKASLVPELMKHVPSDFDVYHEPFLGGGALFFALQPKRSCLNDLNMELVDTYKAVRDEPDNVIQFLSGISHSPETYAKIRALDPAQLPEPVRAARFIYLNKTGFNGLYRVNRSGKFNVPMGKYKNPTFCDQETLRRASMSLRSTRGTLIYSIPFEYALAGARPGDFVYLDPPYDKVSETSFTAYTKDAFKWEDQERLAAACHKLHERGVKFLLSNAATERIIKLYAGYGQRFVQARRSVNSNGNGRGPVQELLIWNGQP